MSHRYLPLSLVLMAATAVGAGCSAGAPTSESDRSNVTETEAQRSPDGVESNLLGTVSSVQVNDLAGGPGAIIGEHGKIAAVLAATGLDPASSLPRQAPGLKCKPNYILSFRAFSGETVGSAGFLCEEGDTDSVEGRLSFDGATYRVTGNLTKVMEVAQSPERVGDILYGIDGVRVSEPRRNRSVETEDPEVISEILAQVSRSQVPDVTIDSWPKCPPELALEFRRGSDAVAFVDQYECDGAPESGPLAKLVVSTASGGEIVGAIVVDGAELARIAEDLAGD